MHGYHACTDMWDAVGNRKGGGGPPQTQRRPASPFFSTRYYGQATCRYPTYSIQTEAHLRDYLEKRTANKVPTNRDFHDPLMLFYCSQVLPTNKNGYMCKQPLGMPPAT